MLVLCSIRWPSEYYIEEDLEKKELVAGKTSIYCNMYKLHAYLLLLVKFLLLLDSDSTKGSVPSGS